ncbi:MAG TPA: phospholipase D-like domain-containing protein [Vicinamibacterales bacterium]|nr:phospholipase D-like domain-containing protein [Vicinamibacterales bacterium]
MSRVTQRALQDQTTSTSSTIIQPGRNCWRVDQADAFHCIQDAADYFRLVRRALLDARDTVFILGWDFSATIDLDPGGDTTEAPTRLDELIAFVSRRRPELKCYILIWDYGALYTLEREPLTRWRLRWRTRRNVRFGFDDHHPVGASHHQKIVVVDDHLAFCGSIDLTGHRWDECSHRLEEPARKSLFGTAYDPYHEVQVMVSGPVATSLGRLVRDRWRSVGYEKMPLIGGGRGDLWPSSVTPELTDVGVAIARTVPPSEGAPAIRECEALFHDSIALAKHTIYIENQYFTDDSLADALSARLQEPDGPEIIVVAPKQCEGWLERRSMGAFRDVAFERMTKADRHGRLRLVYPIASRSRDIPTFIHSKVMIVDDELVRVGSANFARRSMGMDTECDLAVEAAGDVRVRRGIRGIRDRLVAEHLGLEVDEVAKSLARPGSLHRLIDARQTADRALIPITPVGDHGATASATLKATIDPDEPIGFGPTLAHLVPPVDATGGGSPLRLWILPAIAVVAAMASASVINTRPEFQSIRDALAGTSSVPSALWMGTMAFVGAGLLLVPLELLTIAAAVAFGAARGFGVAALGSIALAVIGYAAGRAIGADGVARWISRRSYRSVRQVGAHGVAGVIVLRLSSVAGTGAIHLLCGAGRVRFLAYMAGTIIGIAPALVALSVLGGLLRDNLLQPSVTNGLATIAAAVVLIILAGIIRMFLLIRQFAPSMTSQRHRAEFG